MSKASAFLAGLPKALVHFDAGPDYTTRKAWQRAFQDSVRHYRRLDRQKDTRGVMGRYDLEGAMLQRRERAVLNTMDEIYERFGHLLDGGIRHNLPGQNWIHLNLPLITYSQLDSRYYLLRAAALWILDQLPLENFETRRALGRLLPEELPWEVVNAADIWDTQYDDELVLGVQYILHCRNAPDGEYPEMDGADLDRVLTDSASAAGVRNSESENRRRFEALMAMLPPKAVERAEVRFKKAFWRWTERYFTCLWPLVLDTEAHLDTLNEIIDRHNTLREEFIRLFLENEKRREENRKMRRKLKNGKLPPPEAFADMPPLPVPEGPLQRAPVLPQDGSPASTLLAMAADPSTGQLMRLGERLGAVSDEYADAVEQLETLSRRESEFSFTLVQDGVMQQESCRQQFGDGPAAAMAPQSFPDPFEYCFALLYLIEKDSDLPWLYGPGAGLMMEVSRALPWGYMDYDEDTDYIVLGEAMADRPSAMPDWYEPRYAQKDNPDEGLRSLAQIVYEATGCVMPRDMHRFDPMRRRLSRHGLRGKDALMVMACMTALSHARRRVAILPGNDYGLLPEEEEPAPEAPAAPDPEETQALREELRRLKTALHEAESGTRDARRELNALRDRAEAEHRELADLREVLFLREQSAEEQEAPEDTESFPYTVRRDTLIFGGHSTWEKAIKPMLTGSVRFIPRDLVFDTSIIRRAEVIWIQTNAISHKQYYRIVDTARQYGRPIRYFSFASAAKCARQLMENDSN